MSWVCMRSVRTGGETVETHLHLKVPPVQVLCPQDAGAFLLGDLHIVYLWRRQQGTALRGKEVWECHLSPGKAGAAGPRTPGRHLHCGGKGAPCVSWTLEGRGVPFMFSSQCVGVLLLWFLLRKSSLPLIFGDIRQIPLEGLSTESLPSRLPWSSTTGKI